MLAAVFDAPASFHSDAAATERVDELIDMMGLDAFREKLVGELSTGSRRIVDLACVLAQDPAVVLLDEPSAGVAQRETEARHQRRDHCSVGWSRAEGASPPDRSARRPAVTAGRVADRERATVPAGGEPETRDGLSIFDPSLPYGTMC